ncbi:MAG: hypothetical protein V4591_02550 [Bdellovibrionota bacterium]
MFSTFNKDKFLHGGHSQELDDAPDKPPTRLVAVVVTVSFIFVFILIALSFPVIENLSTKQGNEADTGMGNTERIVYISNQKKIMSSYEKIDDNHYQIPIMQAMKMVVMTQGDISKIQEK